MLCRRPVLALVFAGLLSLPAKGYGEDNRAGIAEVNGAKLYYEMVGEGQPLVLIHGGGLDRRMWDEQFQMFAEHSRVIRYDVRGYGKSEASHKPYASAEDLYGLLQFLQVEKADIVGLSLGGRIAVDLALTHPEVVILLIPVAPGLSGFQFSAKHNQEMIELVNVAQEDGETRAVELWLQNPYMKPGMENPTVGQRIRSIAMENAQVWLMAPLERPLSPPAINRLSEIHAPTLIIVGDRDIPDIQKIARTLETGIPGAKKVVIHGAGHMVNMEKPEEFNRVVLEFLSKR
jgi:pimeloyl-ACP methyl ester carboxylesterase